MAAPSTILTVSVWRRQNVLQKSHNYLDLCTVKHVASMNYSETKQHHLVWQRLYQEQVNY